MSQAIERLPSPLPFPFSRAVKAGGFLFLSGQVPLIATGNVVTAAILARNPPKKPETKFLIKNSPCYIGLNKDEPKLRAKVNEILANAKRDGSLAAISKKWLGADLPKDL